MRKNINILKCLAAFPALFLSSCEKDFNCTCNIKTTSSSGTIFSAERYPITAKDRKTAKRNCEAYIYTPTAPGATATYSCSLD
ncbi:MAG: hypothetical protein KF744_05940 [Taibaiella sp.]|nr:hypothetical protein [Taibaiella sp.]